LPGRNFGTLAAAILISAPVRGLRPILASRWPTSNVPKPTNDTESPFCNASWTAAKADSRARVALALEISACWAMWSMRSDLFTGYSLCVVNAVTANSCPLRRQKSQVCLGTL